MPLWLQTHCRIVSLCSVSAHYSLVFVFYFLMLILNLTLFNDRDVPDIRFRLAGYPAIFSNPVPAPVPAKLEPGTGYLSRIVLSPFCAFRASLQHCTRSRH